MNSPNSLREGEAVEFGLEHTQDGRQKAVNVTGPSGEFVQARKKAGRGRDRSAGGTGRMRAPLHPPGLAAVPAGVGDAHARPFA